MHTSGRKASSIDAKTDLSALTPEAARTLLASVLEADPEAGTLRLANRECVIIRPEAIVNIQRQLEATIGGSSKGILYLAGERSARGGVTPLESLVGGMEPPKDIEGARRIAAGSALLGWGRVEISSFDTDVGRVQLNVRNSPLALAYGPWKKPVCHFLAGWIAGLCRTILGRDLLCEETACVAQGRERCDFDVRPLAPP